MGPWRIFAVHDVVIKWKPFPRHWPIVRGIHQSLVNSPHKGQWRGALVFSLICAWTNGWINHWDAGYLWRHRAHYDGTVIYRYFLADADPVAAKPVDPDTADCDSDSDGADENGMYLTHAWILSSHGIHRVVTAIAHLHRGNRIEIMKYSSQHGFANQRRVFEPAVDITS